MSDTLCVVVEEGVRIGVVGTVGEVFVVVVVWGWVERVGGWRAENPVVGLWVFGFGISSYGRIYI